MSRKGGHWVIWIIFFLFCIYIMLKLICKFVSAQADTINFLLGCKHDLYASAALAENVFRDIYARACKFLLLLLCIRTSCIAQCLSRAKEKYRGIFEIQMSGDKTSSGEIGLDIRTRASPKVGQDQVSGGVSVLCWHATDIICIVQYLSSAIQIIGIAQ